ncbi:hypothetical protein KSP39_PZI014495 [Platanthera zijinensis]|uniref:HMA domain-containing protein n=1 Tax=Platanthera zijinensis TaxID=2320716 RepID=A0AAP0G2K4_9ASPA
MRATKLGLLCRSQAATAVCAPGDIQAAVVVPRRPDRSNSEHSKLAVTLPMVTKRGIDPPEPKSRLPKSPHVLLNLNFTLHAISPLDCLQVVVMRVSIHCQGCAGKVSKHISKMEGVTSFSIDVESKRVTVMGHVSPAGVLQSISKVKKAEFWSPC